MQCYDEFKVAFPHTRLKENVKYVKDGNIVTSGGISAGINMSLFVVGDLLGKEIANKVAALMEYDYTEG
jgi:transcriptional regulator GlxA family with amidase domain